jgi:hypothetical protein
VLHDPGSRMPSASSRHVVGARVRRGSCDHGGRGVLHLGWYPSDVTSRLSTVYGRSVHDGGVHLRAGCRSASPARCHFIAAATAILTPRPWELSTRREARLRSGSLAIGALQVRPSQQGRVMDRGLWRYLFNGVTVLMTVTVPMHSCQAPEYN